MMLWYHVDFFFFFFLSDTIRQLSLMPDRLSTQIWKLGILYMLLPMTTLKATYEKDNFFKKVGFHRMPGCLSEWKPDSKGCCSGSSLRLGQYSGLFINLVSRVSHLLALPERRARDLGSSVGRQETLRTRLSLYRWLSQWGLVMKKRWPWRHIMFDWLVSWT